MRSLLWALAATVVLVSPSVADDAARAQLAGRTLNITLGFDNSGSGARYWSVVLPALTARLPDTQIRSRFNEAGEGIAALNDLFAEPPNSLSLVYVIIPELAFGQTHGMEGVAFDLAKGQYVIGVQRQGQVMAVRRGFPLDIEELRKPGQRILVPTDVINGSSAVQQYMLNAATGINTQLVVGFNSAESQRALLVGDVDMMRQQLSVEVNALLEEGEIFSLYTMTGTGFPPSVDTSRTLQSVTLPATPQPIIDYVIAMSQLGRAFIAGPNADPKDVDALRTIFEEVMSDQAVLDELAKQVAVVSLVRHADVERLIKDLLLPDPKDRAAVDLAHSCGVDMSRGTIERCDWSTLGQ